MKKLFFFLAVCFATKQHAAQDTAKKWVVAFPITDYIVASSDTMKIVQVQLPAGATSIAKKQLGLLKGIYRNGTNKDTGMIGAGRCQLIKGDYYYFTVSCYNKDKLPKAGDLIYTMIDKAAIYYGRIAKLAAHRIVLQTVDETNLYDPWQVINSWTKQSETGMITTIIADIKYTGVEMTKLSPGSNKKIITGVYKDKMVFDVMQNLQVVDVENFLAYMIARPNNYAGNSWKVSEIFATWADAGAPTVIKD